LIIVWVAISASIESFYGIYIKLLIILYYILQ